MFYYYVSGLLAPAMMFIVMTEIAQECANDKIEPRSPLLPDQTRAIGEIHFLLGAAHDLSILRAGETGWKPAKLRMKIYSKDLVRTGAQACCEVKLRNGAIVRIGEQTLFGFSQVEISDSSKADFGLRRFWAKLSAICKEGDRSIIKLPTAVCSIRG